MYGQVARAHQFEFNLSVSIFPNFFFFKISLSRKNWQGRGKLLMKNAVIYGYAC